jgi:hypothetical protein
MCVAIATHIVPRPQKAAPKPVRLSFWLRDAITTVTRGPYPAFSSSIGSVRLCFFTISAVIVSSVTFLLPGT